METTLRAEDGARTTVAPSLGVVLAGIALAASFLPWTGRPPVVPVESVDGSALAAVLAGVAVLAFVARRHGGLDRRVGGSVAGLALLGVVGVALYRLVAPAVGGGTTPSVTYGLPVAGFAALFGVTLAAADTVAIPDDRVLAKLKAASLALGIGLLGFVVSSVIATVPALVVRQFGTTVSVAVLTAGSGIGFGVFAVGYLRQRGLDFDYIDLDWPDLGAVAYGIGGLVLLFVSAGLVSVVFTQLGLPSAESSIEDLASQFENPEFLLVLIPLSFLAIGPGEELVYRNIVQKYLYESFSRRSAVVVASVIFGVIHFQQYADPNPVATLSTLFVVFVLSLVLGYTYYKTENLLVPIFIHGTFNALQFAALYVQLTGGTPTA